MKQTYKPFTYCCPHCSRVQQHYAWQHDVKKAKHTCKTEGCKTVLTAKDIFAPTKIEVPGLRTPTKNRV